jgi:hypothetical protein
MRAEDAYGGVRAGGVRGEWARGNHSSTQGCGAPNDEVGGADDGAELAAPTPQASCQLLPVWLSSINHIAPGVPGALAAGVPCPPAPGVPGAPAAGVPCPPAAGVAGDGPDKILKRSVGSAVCADALSGKAADSPRASNPAMTAFDHWLGIWSAKVLRCPRHNLELQDSELLEPINSIRRFLVWTV